MRAEAISPAGTVRSHGIMTRTKRIAYYAPLKPPDHPIPSGDRQMGRMLLAALRRAGYDVFLASRYISYSKRHGAEHLAERKAGAHREAERLIREWDRDGNPPDLWFCYHPYDKSPDWLGAEICSRLGIAMVTAEPCKTGQGPNGEWLPWRAEAQKSLAMADMNIALKPADVAYLSDFVDRRRITRIDPFIDVEQLETSPVADDPWRGSGCRLLAVGMMRPGAKTQSYRVLAEALSGLRHLDWSLAIVGGGPTQDEVRACFAWDTQGRVAFAGERDPGEVMTMMEMADVLAWPGSGEAFGMVYLEAAACGTPAAALDNKGVPLVVIDGRTGLLASPPDPETYARVLERIIADDGLRLRLGEGARRFALEERSGQQAAAQLRTIIDGVFAKREMADR